MSMWKLNRRAALAAAGAGFLAAGSAASPRTKGAPPSRRKRVEVREATNIALAVSPDGKTLAFDLLGVLWTLPIAGGVARRLTGDFDDLAWPDWSPDGNRIAVQSYRSGRFKIWSVAAKGGDWRVHTSGDADDREPRWSPDGRTIAFSSDRSQGRYAIHLLDVATGQVTLFSKGKSQDSQPCWSPDGRTIAYVANGVQVFLAPLDGSAPRLAAAVETPKDSLRASDRRLVRPPELHAPSFARDGGLTYVRVDERDIQLVKGRTPLVTTDDLYPFPPAWLADGGLVYGAAGKIRRQAPSGEVTEIPFRATASVEAPHYERRWRDFDSTTPRPVVGIGSPQLSPDGTRIVFRALNDLWLLPIGGHPKRVVGGPFYKSDPAWSPDGQTLAYCTDQGGSLDVWLHDVATGVSRQVTDLPGLEASSCTWSRDGRAIAFLDQNTHLQVLDLATGAVQQLYDRLFEPGRPSFGPDDRCIAMAAVRPTSARYREGFNEILVVDRASGEGAYRSHAPGKSLSTRGDDGPVWSPDGRHIAYVFASTLWVAPVDAAGAFTGSPRQVTTETTDAPSWSGDSETLLYLSNGKLRLVDLAGGAPRTVDCPLTWANAKPQGRLVVRASRLWDASEPRYRSDVDVVVEANRIAAVLPRAEGPPSDANARFVDGTGLTLLPGLIDMHTHRLMQGYAAYGDRMGRLWLSMGITSTRSPGCPAYHMVEDREALDSGARIGPRHFATGEAIDGARVFYNFMRPVTEPDQLDLEMARAEALSYDLVKTYVRLAHADQAEVIKRAHALGMPVVSHYHYPALNIGADGMEHLGATNRYGYSRSLTKQGAGYEDVNRLFAAARAARTPTLFTSAVLLAEDDGFLRDARFRTLMPRYDLDRMAARVRIMRNGDPGPALRELERNVQQIKDTMAAGWRVVTGTDAPIDFVAASLHLNLRAMVRFGVSAHDTLLSATRHAGELLDDGLGAIRPGQLADMMLVDGDPLMNIDDLANVRHVFVNGAVHTPDTLMAPFARSQVAALSNEVLAPAAPAGRRYWWHTAEWVEGCRDACCCERPSAWPIRT